MERKRGKVSENAYRGYNKGLETPGWIRKEMRT